MTLQDLVDSLMSHPLYQEGKGRDVDIVVVDYATHDTAYIKPVANDLITLPTKSTRRERLALTVHRG